MKRKMHLAFDMSWTHLEGRWRTPGSWTGTTFPDMRIYQEVAQIAERGCIDMLFFGDGNGIPSTWRGSPDEAVRWGIGWPRHDMSPYISAISQTTRHVGFGLTYSTTFMHPFYVARLLNALDHVTNGRIGFNVITSSRRADAANYGFDELMEHGQRYERLEEFIDVCKALWASVDPDALIWDRETGQVADPSKVRAINHRGKFFNVKGPLASVPSPQRRPVIIQAGASGRGIEASAQVADHVFAASPGLARQVQHRKELDAALVAKGRDPSKVGMFWDVVLLVEETEAEALRRREQMLTALPFEAVGAFMSHQVGYDLSRLPDKFTVSEINAEITASNASPVNFLNVARGLPKDDLITREDFYAHAMRGGTGYDHTVAGSARQVADYLEEVFEATGENGGFMCAHPQATPRDFLNVVDFLIPELRRRGRFRTEYRGRTLAENLSDD
jgi:FMN-dependent oxidoreductase (nitrilotriacetate monooxygenase family)